MWIILIAAAFLLVSFIVACFVDEIKRSKENRKSSLDLFLNSALRTYKYPEESNKEEK